MRVAYLRSALPDLTWFRAYYEAIFPGGARHALLLRRAIERLLRENPFAGRVVQEETDTRVFPISRTPFIMVYRVMEDRIEVLRVWDGRREPADFQF